MLSFVLNRVLKIIEGIVLHRVGILGYFCPKQGQGFKPPVAPLYPNMGQVPPWGQSLVFAHGCFFFFLWDIRHDNCSFFYISASIVGLFLFINSNGAEQEKGKTPPLCLHYFQYPSLDNNFWEQL